MTHLWMMAIVITTTRLEERTETRAKKKDFSENVQPPQG
jgi:hypothetical protein